MKAKKVASKNIKQALRKKVSKEPEVSFDPNGPVCQTAKKIIEEEFVKAIKESPAILFSPFGDNDSSLSGAFEAINSALDSQYDEIEHPKHYKGLPNGVECWDVTQFFPTNIGSALKYLWRAGEKPGQDKVKDLKKALQYIQHEIDLVEENYPKMTK